MARTIGYEPFEFEGSAVPGPGGLRAALLVEADRPRLVRAAVVYSTVAEAALEVAEGLLASDDDDEEVRVGLQLVDALGARKLVPTLVERLPSWVGRGQIARHAFELVVRLAPPIAPHRYRALRWAMTVPELRLLAWHALADDDPEATLPHLAELLDQAPQLAGQVATRFAIVHTAHCLRASQQIARLDEPTRRAFAADLEHQLKRIFQVRIWAECRRALFGR